MVLDDQLCAVCRTSRETVQMLQRLDDPPEHGRQVGQGVVAAAAAKISSRKRAVQFCAPISQLSMCSMVQPRACTGFHRGLWTGFQPVEKAGRSPVRAAAASRTRPVSFQSGRIELVGSNQCRRRCRRVFAPVLVRPKRMIVQLPAGTFSEPPVGTELLR